MYFIYANSNNSKSFVFIKKRLEIYIKLRVSFTLNKSVGFNIRFVVVVVSVAMLDASLGCLIALPLF